MNKNYIILNGKYYDAVTGALIKPVSNPSQATHTRVSQTAKATRPATAKSTAKTTPATTAKTTVKKATTRTHHGAPKILKARKPQQSKTLMRSVVKKPALTQKPQVKKAYPLAKTTSGITVAPKKSVATVDHSRLQRAQQISKSTHISRFTEPTKPLVTTKVKPLSIKPAPAQPVAATPKAADAKTVKNHAKAPKTLEEKKRTLLENALANAKSHEEPAPKVARTSRFKRRKLISSLAGMSAVLLIAGFVVYLNKASVELQLASVRAGFQASMPTYTPEGYERQATRAENKTVTISFVSPIHNSQFTITQEASSWDSQTLFDSIIAQDKATTYQTIQSNGRTIYIYDDNKAAWVDGGILYKVSGNAKLKSDQIVSLATSM